MAWSKEKFGGELTMVGGGFTTTFGRAGAEAAWPSFARNGIASPEGVRRW